MGFLDRFRGRQRSVDAIASDLGLHQDDLTVLGQMNAHGADLRLPRTVDYFVHFPTQEAAIAAMARVQADGYDCDVTAATDATSNPWTLVAKKPGVVLADADSVARARDLFDGLASDHGGTFDGWGAPIQPD